MTYLSRLVSILFAGSIIFSCTENEYREATYFEALAPFHAVELNSVFDVYLIQDSTYSLEVIADEAMIKKVVFSVDEGVLRIENTANLKWLNPKTNKIKLHVRANRLSEIFPNETCYIKSVNPIISEDFRVVMGHHPKLAELDLELNNGTLFYWNNHQCGGRLMLRGKTRVLNAYTFGYMSIEAENLSADYALIENNSKGDCKVWVNDKIECSIRGVGDIYLYGDPDEVLLVEQTSKGELIHMD